MSTNFSPNGFRSYHLLGIKDVDNTGNSNRDVEALQCAIRKVHVGDMSPFAYPILSNVSGPAREYWLSSGALLHPPLTE